MEETKTVLFKGKLKRVPKSTPVDYKFENPSDFFSTSTNLITNLSGVSGGRVLLGDKAMTQAVSLVNRETPLVQTIPQKGSSSFETKYGNKYGSITAEEDGVVVYIDDDEIQVKSKSRTKTYYIYNYFVTGRKSFLKNEVKVKVGDHVKKGQVLATSNYTDDKGRLALGTNLTTAIMPYRSANFEDAYVVSETGAKKLTSEQLFSIRVEKKFGTEIGKAKWVAMFPNKFYNTQLSKIDDSGVIRVGQKLHYGDPVILAYSPKTLKTEDIQLGKLSKALKHAFKDLAETWDYESEGEVVQVANTPSLVTVTVKTTRGMNVGDKLSVGFGAKGVLGRIVPDSEAPTMADGKPVDVILNSMSITSRVAPGLAVAMAAGKVAKKLGHPISATPFIKGSSVEAAQKMLKKHNISDMEPLYDPVSGKTIKAMVGPLYINRLVHIAEDKVSDRGSGIAYDWQRQPGKTTGESAKRIGNLASMALLSHGASKVLKDIATIKSTRNDEYWRKMKLGQPLPTPGVPFVFDKFVASLQGAGVSVNKNGDEFKILPMTDKEVAELSNGEIVNASTLKISGGNLEAEPGGLYDPNKVGLLGDKFNHISLDVKVPNPISETYFRKLLNLTQGDYLNQVASGEAVSKIEKMDLDEKIKEYAKYLKTGKTAEKNNAVKMLSFLKTLKENNIHPKDLILSKIPVIPAQFRPTQVAGDMILSADVNNLYRDVLLINKSLRGAKDVPVEVVNDTKKKLYDAVKAVYGLEDPVTQKSQEKHLKGLLGTTLGIRGGSAKSATFQAKVVNKPIDLVGRGVSVPDATLDLDTISLPQDMVWKLYTPFVIRRMVQQGVPAVQAHEFLKLRNNLAVQALHAELADRPGILSRDPSLHKFNLQGFFVKPNADSKDSTIHVNPLVTKGFNLDFDGDQQNFHVPASDDAKEEVKEKMLPSRNLLSPRSFGPAYVPSNEAALGLFLLSEAKGNGKPAKKFKTEQEVIAAFHRGDVDINDMVEITEK